MKKDLIVVIDGNSIAYRAFYALPMLVNKNGDITNAIYGFANMLFKAIEDLEPTHVAVVFDYPDKLKRHEIYAAYKGTRKPMPAELVAQMPVLKNLLKLMGITVLEQKGDEADDIIGSIAKKFDTDTVIVTGDRDCLQLIDSSTKVMLTKKGLTTTVVYDDITFINEYGFPPINIVDLKAIMGDASDNIPGVAGIGEKGATDLITNYLTLENVYENLNTLKPRTKDLLTESKDVAFMSKTLATIDTKVEIKQSLADFKLMLPFKKEAAAELNRLQFVSILKKEKYFSPDSLENSLEMKKAEQIVLKTKEEVISKLSEIKDSFAFIINESRMEFAVNTEKNYKVNLKLNLIDDGLNFLEIINLFKPVLENKNIKKICFNFKLNYYFFKNYNINLSLNNFNNTNNLSGDYLKNCDNNTKSIIDDTLISGWLLDANAKMEKIEEFFIYENVVNEAASLIFINDNNYNEMKKLNVLSLYHNIEIPLMFVLIDMEEAGFKIDEVVLQELSDTYTKNLNKLTDEIYEIAEQKFNINSPKQLGEILFDKLKLPKYKKESTAIDALNYLKSYHPIIQKIIDYREDAKLYNTYIAAFKEILKNNTGFIHTTFNPVGTNTGRLSSVNPNLQNIPVRTEKGKELRKLFISRFIDGKIISADYNQIELRLVANFSGDETMINSYLLGKDIHTTTASQIFNKNEKDITKEERRQAKAVNFGIIYGISPFGLSEQIGIFPAQASAYIEKYFANFPKVKTYLDKSVEDAKNNNGYVTTIFGRKRKINELFNSNANLRHFGERAAKNMPLQGSASDVIKLAMIRVNNKIKAQNLKSKLVLQIHDELVVDCFKGEEKIVSQILKDEMENVVKLTVPLTADVEAGLNLYEV